MFSYINIVYPSFQLAFTMEKYMPTQRSFLQRTAATCVDALMESCYARSKIAVIRVFNLCTVIIHPLSVRLDSH